MCPCPSISIHSISARKRSSSYLASGLVPFYPLTPDSMHSSSCWLEPSLILSSALLCSPLPLPDSIIQERQGLCNIIASWLQWGEGWAHQGTAAKVSSHTMWNGCTSKQCKENPFTYMSAILSVRKSAYYDPKLQMKVRIEAKCHQLPSEYMTLELRTRRAKHLL